MELTSILIIVIALMIISFVIYIFYNNKKLNTQVAKTDTNKDNQNTINQLRSQIEDLKITIGKKDQQVEQIKRLNNEEKSNLSELEKILNTREDNLEQRAHKVEEKARTLDDSIEQTNNLKNKLNKTQLELEKKIYEVANLTPEEAKDKVMKITEENLNEWMAKEIKIRSKNIELEAENIAQTILMDAMQSATTDYISDVAVTRFQLASEEQKGKIIGKEGRNIKTIERLTGVEIIIEDDSSSISISCFDPIRREVAAIAISRLLKDGRMHPGTIEETIEKVKNDLVKIIKKEGLELATKAGFYDLPEEIIKLLGKYKYRFSYGQNLARHTLEVVQIAESIAKDLKLDVKAVKLAALLHDIGKVVITDSLGSDNRQHHHISGEIARKYKFSDKVINAIEAHHDDIESKYVESEILKIADKISGSRIGARKENYEDYIKRIKALEDVALSYDKVKEAFAIHAGREVRVILTPQGTNDADVQILAQKIAEQIHNTQNYPRIIKVVVIRERRSSANA